MKYTPTLPLAPITPLNYCTSAKGVFDDTTPAQMHEAILAYANVCREKTLALYFHGGLVKKNDGMQTAQQLVGPYAAADGTNAGNAYPYFFVWESGLIETLVENLPRIYAENIFQQIRGILETKAKNIQLRASMLPIAESGKNETLALTLSDIDDVQRAVASDPIINADKQRIALSAKPLAEVSSTFRITTPRSIQMSPITMLSPDIVSAIVAEEAHKAAVTKLGAENLWDPISWGALAFGAGKVLSKVVQRFMSGRNHNLHNTVEEEMFRQFYIANVGWSIWNDMKDETRQAFSGDAEHNVGTALIKELLALYESGDDGRASRITLVGHSAGAIYICNFLGAMHQALSNKSYARHIKFDVILMAPAVRVDTFSNVLRTYGSLINNFRVFEMSDSIEAADPLVQDDNTIASVNKLLAQIYTSSLLYFISGVLEGDDDDDDTPITGMQRFFLETGAFLPGRVASIDAVRSFYATKQNAVIVSNTSSISPQPADGRRCTSMHHCGFPIDPETLQSVCYLLQTGRY